jgi:hypothetical protein
VASQTANDVDTAPVIGLATIPGADKSIQIRVDDGKVLGVWDTIEGVRDGTTNVDKEQDIIENPGARVIDGAHVVLNRYLNHPELSYFLGDEKIIQPIASDWGALSRG